MDQSVLLEGITEHLDVLQEIFTWALILAIGVTWAAVRGQRKLEIASMSFDRYTAFYIASAAYAGANIAVLLLLGRLHNLLSGIDDAHFVEAYSRLATHSWVLNPFAYVGKSASAALSTQWGIGLLIVSWWICANSVILLRRTQRLSTTMGLLALFYAVGIVALVEIKDIYSLNVGRLQVLAPTIYGGVRATATGRWIAAFAAPIVGLLLFLLAWWYQRSTRVAPPNSA